MNLNETTTATSLNSDLKAGLRSLDRLQEVTFVKYVRLVLPVDGFVFWVKANKISHGALLNASALNTSAWNATVAKITETPEFKVFGSLHYTTDNRQELDQTIGLNRVTFTSETDVDDFNEIGESVLFIATIDDIQFSFSQRGNFFSQAGLYHYSGEAIHPAMRSQILDTVTFFDDSQIVCNSLPIFMALNQYMPVYPSFLVKQNARPPYAAIDIQQTEAIAAAPTVDRMSNRDQLCQEKVKLTIYGLNNNKALDYVDYVVSTALGSFDFGVMNMPVLQDEKRPQTDLNVIAQKKTVEFQVNYYQSRMINIARQLILSAFATTTVNPAG